MWTTLFVLTLILIVGRHVTSLRNFYWSSTLREAPVDALNGTVVTGPLLHEHRLLQQSGNALPGTPGNPEDAVTVLDSSMSGTFDTQVDNVFEASEAVSVPSPYRWHRFRCREGSPSNIVFLKIHKSGSTTVANVLARYALRHHLNVALPNKTPGKARFNYFRPRDLGGQVIPRPRNEHFHVLFNHMIYNRSSLDSLLPEETFYCGIMREPLSRFLSSVNYYHTMLPPNLKQYLLFGPKALPTHPKAKQGLPRYQPTQQQVDLKQLLKGPERELVERRCEVFNSLACNTGLPVKLYGNSTAVVQHAVKLNGELDLMMVMEHFEESLVLLKRRACLSMEDIVFLRLNSARTNSARKLTDDDEHTLRHWQAADQYLYEFFYDKFLHEVKREGETFWQEVDLFKNILTRTQNFCDKLSPSQRAVLEVAASRWSKEFNLTAKDCELMHLKELAMQRRLISRAWRRIAEAESG